MSTIELTDAEWREFQSIPDQGYSHRAWVDSKIKARLDAEKPQPVAVDRESLGEILALVDDHDGCHARVREWEGLEQWEKDAHPDEEPCTDREDAEWWNRRADAVIAHLAARPATGTGTVECGTCDGRGVIGGPPDQYGDCPECVGGEGDADDLKDDRNEGGI